MSEIIDPLLEVVQLAKYLVPQSCETKSLSDDTMIKYGTFNDYPNHLLHWYHNCPIHASIINAKASYIIGDGLKLKSGGDIDFKLGSESIHEFLEKIVKDFLIHNAFAVECQYNELTFKTDTLAYNHIPAHTLRLNNSKSHFWYSSDWKTKSRSQFEYDRWSLYNPDSKSKIFWYDGYIPSVNKVYMEPDYTACIESIITDIAIRGFNRNNIMSNFSVSKIITCVIGDNPPKQIQDEWNRKIGKFLVGEGEKYILNFKNPGSEDKIKIDNIDANSWDKAYESTKAFVQDDIYQGHSFSDALLRATPGKLSNAAEIEVLYEIFKNNYIQNKRSQLESALSLLFGVEVEFIDRPLFSGRIPDATKEKVYTINELRALDNLPALPDGDKLLQILPQQPLPQAGATTNNLNDQLPVNSVLTNLSGRQLQQVTRIARQFGQGKLTESQASIMLKNGFGFSDEDVKLYLGIECDEQDFSLLFKNQEFRLSGDDFEKVKHMGIPKSQFEFIALGDEEELSKIEMKFDRESDISNYVLNNDIKGLTIDELKILIRRDLEMNITTKELQSTLKKLGDAGVIKYTESKGIIDIKPPAEPKIPNNGQVQVMYSYEVKPGLGAPLISTSRDFCVKLIENDRYYSRMEIQTMTGIFGYDIFQYTGGYYFNPQTQEISKSCRHKWVSTIVTPKNNDN